MNLITICARGGSKGVPRKNIKQIGGKPLIAYSIQIAQKFAVSFNAVLELSTDDPEIRKIASEYGVVTDYLRPNYLATDNAGKIETIRDLLIYSEEKYSEKFEYILDLDVSSPLRSIEDLTQAFALIQKNHDAINLFSVSRAKKNPYFNMVELTESGFARLVKDYKIFMSRQNAPEVFEMNASFYFFKREFFTQGWKISTTDCSLMYLIPHICFDLDEKIDFILLEYLIKESLLDFKL